jgi:hypothetical protein
MAMVRAVVVIAAFLITPTFAVNEASAGQDVTQMSVQAMEQVFDRSEKSHFESMAAITKSMSSASAWQLLKKNNLTTPALIQVTGGLFDKQLNLRKQTPQKGYSGLEGARKLLNDMIYESMSKYDAEIAKCTEYYSVQCAGMEACRGQISASNFIAANARSLILDAQAKISRCEVEIPDKKQQRTDHSTKCANELHKMRSRLAIILGDIEIMVIILKMTDCSKSFVQAKTISLLHCTDPCTKKSFVEFKDEGLKKQISRLKASASLKLVKDTFADLYSGVEAMQATEFLELDAHVEPIVNKTKFNNPPVPRTQVPGNPCDDPYGGAPSAALKRTAKCRVPGPDCIKLQERFLLIQAGIKDDRDALLEDIASMEKHCEETRMTLTTQIENCESMMKQAEKDLASASEVEATAGETARQTAAEHDQLDEDLRKQMKTCTKNYLGFEGEICALKKIRGELMKMRGDGHSGFFQDCEVGKWDPEECTKKCYQKGRSMGEQKLTRTVLTHPEGGTKCLPLAAMKKCNLHPCPVDCRLSAWHDWSKCSAECGGGVQQRLREVKRAMKYGGKPCGPTSQTVACNGQSCEKDCELTEWTKWSWCSKDCDGGSRKRQKFIKHAAEGAGTCAGKWAPDRLQYKQCNMHRCEALTCNKTLDVILLIDGSGSLGLTGWKAEIKAAKMFVDAFSGSGARAKMAVVLYSGPFYWSGVRLCTGKSTSNVDLEKTCKIRKVTQFTSDMAKVKELIGGLTWPRGSTLTSLALATAKSMLTLGRKDAKSIVVAITDGRPLSYRNTGIASTNLRKAARLVWVPVTSYAPLASIKQWATRRWQENVVQVNTFADLETPDPVNHIVANICPKDDHVMEFGRLM